MDPPNCQAYLLSVAKHLHCAFRHVALMTAATLSDKTPQFEGLLKGKSQVGGHIVREKDIVEVCIASRIFRK